MNKRQLYESIMKNISGEIKKALNESLTSAERNIVKEFLSKCPGNINYSLADMVLDEINITPEPFINFSNYLTLSDQSVKVFAEKAKYEKRIAQNLGYDSVNALCKQISAECPEYVEGIIFQSFLKNYPAWLQKYKESQGFFE